MKSPLVGKELLMRIRALGELAKNKNETINSCNYQTNYKKSFQKNGSSQRHFFRNFVEAYLKYGDKKFIENA